MTPAPILLLGAPHSGLPEVASALGRLPRLVPLPELRLAHADRVDSLLAMFELCEDRPADGLLRAVATLVLRAPGDAGIRQARAWLERRAEWSTRQLFDTLCDAVAPAVAVLHDTHAPLRIRELDRLLALAPDAHVVHLWCAPEGFSARAGRFWQRRLFRPPDVLDHGAGWPRLAPALLWHRINRQLLEYQPPAAMHWQRLALETVTAQPVRVLGALLADCGLRVPEGALPALRNPGGGPFAGFGPEEAPFGDEADWLRAPQHWPQLPPDAPEDPALRHPDIDALRARLGGYRQAA